MKKNVRLVLSGTQAEGEKIKTDVSALYSFIKDRHYIKFTEVSEEGGETETLLKFDENYFSITKKGEVHSFMEFERGVKKPCDYRTPYGAFFLETETKELCIQVKEEKIEGVIRYDLYMNKTILSESEVVFQISEIQKTCDVE